MRSSHARLFLFRFANFSGFMSIAGILTMHLLFTSSQMSHRVHCVCFSDFVTAILMIPQRQYAFIKQQTSVLDHIASTIMLLLVMANFTSLVLERRIAECPDNPTSYLLLG